MSDTINILLSVRRSTRNNRYTLNDWREYVDLPASGMSSISKTLINNATANLGAAPTAFIFKASKPVRLQLTNGLGTIEYTTSAFCVEGAHTAITVINNSGVDVNIAAHLL